MKALTKTLSVQYSPLADADLAALIASLHGQLIQPDDAEYDHARRVVNGSIDRYPRLIARCADVADVIAAVNFAREHGLAAAIRGGGHNVAGLAVADDAVVVDLSRMRAVLVDPKKRTARVQGGATWGDFDHATHAYGLATPGGIVSTTGVAGLTLGGGIGYLTRRFGLSCDNLLAAEVVTADGKIITASAKEHPDLFWALRGGGGNFGVVTAFEFKLHPVETVIGGPIFYPYARTAELMAFYHDFIASAPETLGAFLGIHKAPPEPFLPESVHNQPIALIMCCYSGPASQAEKVLAPLREFGPPIIDLTGPMPYPMINRMFDEPDTTGWQNYWKSDCIAELPSAAIAQHVAFGAQVPSITSGSHFYPIDGAAARIPADATAFPFRHARYTQMIAAIFEDPADFPAYRQWVRDWWAAAHVHSVGGAYVNFLMEPEHEAEQRIALAFGDNYPRLVEVKTTYDPANLFRVNQNIPPRS